MQTWSRTAGAVVLLLVAACGGSDAADSGDVEQDALGSGTTTEVVDDGIATETDVDESIEADTSSAAESQTTATEPPTSETTAPATSTTVPFDVVMTVATSPTGARVDLVTRGGEVCLRAHAPDDTEAAQRYCTTVQRVEEAVDWTIEAPDLGVYAIVWDVPVTTSRVSATMGGYVEGAPADPAAGVALGDAALVDFAATKKFGAMLVDPALWEANSGQVCSFYEYASPPPVAISSSCRVV